MFSVIYLFCLVALSGIASSGACDFAECKNVDYGSCGNACCKLNVYIKGVRTVDVMDALNSTVVAGGPDNLYIPQPTAGAFVFSDLRPYNISVDFLGQTWHTTVNGLYNDTVNLQLSPTDEGESTNVVAFSISQIGGAYGDDGQNYYNIFQLFDSIKWASGYVVSNADHSCPVGATP